MHRNNVVSTSKVINLKKQSRLSLLPILCPKNFQHSRLCTETMLLVLQKKIIGNQSKKQQSRLSLLPTLCPKKLLIFWIMPRNNVVSYIKDNNNKQSIYKPISQ